MWHMEVPRLGVKSKLQLLACTTATAVWDLSCICDLHHSSWQCWTPDPLRKAYILMDISWICFCCTTVGTPFSFYFIYFIFLFFCLLGPQVLHMEVPRLEAELELQLPAYAVATAKQDLNREASI